MSGTPRTLSENETESGNSLKMNLSFSGCGFLGIYHVGVASCFKEHAPHLANIKISGSSAGAIAACCFLCDVCLGECTSWVLRLAAKARARSLGPLHPSFNIVGMLRDGITDILPENSHEICSGKLFVSLTRVSDRENVIVSQFDSKNDLIQALICSAFVPFYCGLVPPTYKGVRYVDGGLSDNLPVMDEHTVTVSPFAGETDICPMDESHNFAHITLANMSFQFTGDNMYRLSRALFPPHPEILSQMCKRGFDDALKYLQQNNLISCMRHLSIKSTLTPIYCDDDETDEESTDEVDCALMESHDVTNSCVACGDKAVTIEDLPPSVIAALQAACYSANYGYLASVYRNPVFQVLSFAMTPWLLPLDILYNIVVRFLRWIPYIPEDVRNFTSEIVDLIRHLLHRIEKHRHKYSARFTCQMAITEVNYTPQRRSTYADILSEYHAEPVIRNLNIGFAVDFEAGLGDHEIPTTSETLKQLEQRLETMDIDSLDIETRGKGQNIHLHAEGKNITSDSLIPCDEIIDTFEQCISASNRRNSVLSFYYNDEKEPAFNHQRRRSSVNVTELYTLKQNEVRLPNLGQSTFEESEYESDTVTNGSIMTDEQSEHTLDMSWDEFDRKFDLDVYDDLSDFEKSVSSSDTADEFTVSDIEKSGDTYEIHDGNSDAESFTKINDRSDQSNISDDCQNCERLCDFRLYPYDPLTVDVSDLTKMDEFTNSDIESFGETCVTIPDSNVNSSNSSVCSDTHAFPTTWRDKNLNISPNTMKKYDNFSTTVVNTQRSQNTQLSPNTIQHNDLPETENTNYDLPPESFHVSNFPENYNPYNFPSQFADTELTDSSLVTLPSLLISPITSMIDDVIEDVEDDKSSISNSDPQTIDTDIDTYLPEANLTSSVCSTSNRFVGKKSVSFNDLQVDRHSEDAFTSNNNVQANTCMVNINTEQLSPSYSFVGKKSVSFGDLQVKQNSEDNFGSDKNIQPDRPDTCKSNVDSECEQLSSSYSFVEEPNFSSDGACCFYHANMCTYSDVMDLTDTTAAIDQSNDTQEHLTEYNCENWNIRFAKKSV